MREKWLFQSNRSCFKFLNARILCMSIWIILSGIAWIGKIILDTHRSLRDEWTSKLLNFLFIVNPGLMNQTEIDFGKPLLTYIDTIKSLVFCVVSKNESRLIEQPLLVYFILRWIYAIVKQQRLVIQWLNISSIHESFCKCSTYSSLLLHKFSSNCFRTSNKLAC